MADNLRGYAGIHSTIFAAVQFLNHLEPADLSTIAGGDRKCPICNEGLTDSPNQSAHSAVKLPGCGHVFGKSCLTLWLTPFNKEQQDFSSTDSEDDDDEEEEEDLNEFEEGEIGRDPWVDDQEAAAAGLHRSLLMEPQSASPDLDDARPDSNPVHASRTSNVPSSVHEEAMHDLPEHQLMDLDNEEVEAMDIGTERHGTTDIRPEIQRVLDDLSNVLDSRLYTLTSRSQPPDSHNPNGPSPFAEEAIQHLPEHQSIDLNNEEAEAMDIGAERDDITARDAEFHQALARLDDLTDKIVSHLYTLASWSQPSDSHGPTMAIQGDIEFPISLQGELLLQPTSIYEYGPFHAGFTPMPLGPGNNTCPLCRSETFPRPKHGDLIVALTVRMRVWNTAYRFLGIEPTAQDRLYINEIGRFIARRFETWAMDQTESYDVTDQRLADMFRDALHSLVGMGQDVGYRAFVDGWTSSDMHRIWVFAEALKFKTEDWRFWFELDPNNYFAGADMSQLRGWNHFSFECLTQVRRDAMHAIQMEGEAPHVGE
ncbi:MAG: hypothetical protein LQ352_006429 [Teloschistes flavicans]|nr:MAG: hypothetical protein LQ352_006429 [Teloschistes flavicans]